MSDSILNNGYPSMEELKACNGYPSEERFKRGPVAVIECVQEIPCNPCEAACKFGAITVGNPITNLPRLNDNICTGCGVCIAQCSGLAIFVVDKTFSETEAAVSFPHEYLPLPEKGQVVDAVNRSGEIVCKGKAVRINNIQKNDCTPVITLAVPKQFADIVRGMKRLPAIEKNPGDLLVCRCEEITDGEIREAIRNGARTITAIKRRIRAGMGLCQGKTCRKIISRILVEELGISPKDILPGTDRPPVRPVTFGVLGGEDNE